MKKVWFKQKKRVEKSSKCAVFGSIEKVENVLIFVQIIVILGNNVGDGN